MGALDGALSLLGTGAPSRKSAPAQSGGPAWQIPPDVQASRDGERLRILQDELSNETDPANRAALQREIGNTHGGAAQQSAQSAPVAGPLDGALGLLSGGAQADASQAASGGGPDIAVPTITVTAKRPTAPEPSLLDKAVGAGEAGLNLLTGVASAVPAGIAAVGNILSNGKYGTQAGVNDAGKAFQDASGAFTYQPRTAVGKQYAGAVGDALNDSGLTALAPIAELHAAAGSGIAGAAKNQLSEALNTAKSAGNPLASKLGVSPATSIDRIEPTMAKPRVKLNLDGSQTPVTDNPLTAALQPGQVAPAVPVSAPTLANATPELQSTVKTMQDKGKPINPDALQRHVEASTLPVPVKLTAGQATLDPSMISDEMNGRGKIKPTVSPDFYNAQGKALGSNLDAIRAAVAPDVADSHPTALGQTLVDAYKKMDAPIRADISAKYQALKDANGGDFPVAGQDIAAAADQGLNADNVTRFLPAEVKGILDDIREPGKMTFNDFQNYLTILGQQERKAARAGDGTAGHAIGVVRNAFESLPMSEDAAHLKPLLDAARGAAKARFDKIAADPAYKAALADEVPAGEPSPLADKFVSGYVTGNNVRGANLAQMKANLANDPIAHQTIAAATLDHLKGLAKADPATGKFLADGYNKGASQLAMKLPDMVGPEAAQQLQQIGNVAKYTSAQPKGSYVNNSNSLVSALSAPAAAGLRSLLAVKTLGASEAAGSVLSAMKQGKASKNAIAPGAGINKLTNTAP